MTEEIKKLDHKTILLIILSVLCGSLATYTFIKSSDERKVQRVEQSKAFESVSDTLIEIKSYTNSGVNQEKWTELSRNLNIVTSKYKLVASPKKEEVDLLNTVMSNMRSVGDAWTVNVSYGCYGENPSKECLKKYFTTLYEAFSITHKPLEEYLKTNISNFTEDNKTIEKHKSDVVSLRLTLVTISIERFFKFHGTEL